jgi:hypothetical protein
MSVEYLMFLEEVRIISSYIGRLQESINEKVLNAMFFKEDLKAHITRLDKFLIRNKKI